jgi:hypothetical protein
MTGSLPSMRAVAAALSKKVPQKVNICAEGVNGFRDALHRTFRGDTIIYHVGDYAGGRFKTRSTTGTGRWARCLGATKARN